MKLIESLNFVKGAVGKNIDIPILEHFRIQNKTVIGFNGQMALCAPIEVDLDVAPNAKMFIRAIQGCKETISLGLNPAGKLVVTSGNFRSLVECAEPVGFPRMVPAGYHIKNVNGILKAFSLLKPFISENTNHLWATTLLLDKYSAFCTNNVTFLEYWLGFPIPYRTPVPLAAVEEVVRIGLEPVGMTFEPRRLIFHYEGDRWLSTQLFETKWPAVDELLERASKAPRQPIPDGFFDAVDRLLPLTDSLRRIYLLGDKMATDPEPSASGSLVAMKVAKSGIYNGQHLANLRGLAEDMAFDSYPSSVAFTGKTVRGLIAGMLQ